jgi:L-lysine 2,3-aminomutase
LHRLKKIFAEQVNKNAELQEINDKLHLKITYYLSNKMMNQDELDEINKQGLVSKKLVEEVDNWLELKEGELV